MKRSVKSELYIFLKTIIQGGVYIDEYTQDGEEKEREQTFKRVSFIDSAGVEQSCKHFMFYNTDQNDQYFPAVLFDFQDINPDIYNLQIGETKDSPTEKELVRFSLHVPYPKLSSETMTENDYLDHIDWCETIRQAVSGRNFLGITRIKKVGESHDRDSQVIMGKELIFETRVTNYGYTDNVNVNDDTINENAPVVPEVAAVIVKSIE